MPAPDTTSPTNPTGPTPPETRGPLLPGRRALAVALALVVPYLLVATAWLFANPPGAAPDEHSHLIKALAVVRLEMGVPAAPPPAGASLTTVRNTSLTRIYEIPARLSPTAFPCVAFKPDTTAACQPPASVFHRLTGDIKASTPMAAYPPFVYPPMGLAAEQARDPAQAFLYGRLVVLAETAVLLVLATWHLVRWLGRKALLGVAAFLTPLTVFCMAIFNTSGVEIFGALCVASVLVVYLRRPESLLATSTHVVMLVGGTLLVLSRQLGIVAMGLLLLLLLAVGGWRQVLQGLRERRPGIILSVLVIGVSAAASAWWELNYDHPAGVGPLVSKQSLHDLWSLSGSWVTMVQSGIGWFGWLDVHLDPSLTNSWAVMLAVLLVAGLLLGRWRDRIALVLLGAAWMGVATVVYSTVFHSMDAGLQGRHMLPLFAFLPVLAGVAVVDRVRPLVVAVLFTLLGLALPAVQLWSFVLNSKRYAVGMSYPSLDFVPVAKWAPPIGGWYPWLALAAVGSVLMAVSWVWLGVTSRRDIALERAAAAPTPATAPATA